MGLVLYTLGGLRGSMVTGSETVPSTVELSSSSLDRGETATGAVVIPALPLNYDQVVALRVWDDASHGPEVRMEL